MVRILTVIVLGALTPALVSAFWAGIQGIAAHHSIWVSFAAGTGISLILDRLLHRRMVRFEVFEHELTHASAALLFLRRIRGFAAGKSSGAVVHSDGFGGKVGNDFIGLAPYFLPTFTMAAVLLRPAFSANWFPWYDGFIGLTFGYHAWSTIRETGGNWHSKRFKSALGGDSTQSDIGSRGFLFSGVYIFAMNLFLHGLLSFIIVRGYGGIVVWGRVVGSAFVRFWTGFGPLVAGWFGG